MTARVPALDLHFPPLPDHSDLPGLAAAILDEVGVVAVHETGPDTAPVWRVFPVRGSLSSLTRRLEEDLGPQGLRVESVEVPDEDWAARSQADLKHVVVGSLIIAPPWDIPAPLQPGQHVIVIRPSTGFGTGHHETTRLCLRLLQELDLRDARVLDIGTGSGVLALAAAGLGAADVEGVDLDEDALAAARDNLALNAPVGHVTLRAADVVAVDLVPADVVTANLTGALLTAAAERIAGVVRPGGTLIVSGFLVDEEPAVRAAFEVFGGRLTARTEGAWAAFRATFGQRT